jgi:predicted nucleotide-binding protein (sugar kinase/HSP70/actin superfamily)
MEDIRSMLLANAVNTDAAVKIFNHEWERILNGLESKEFAVLKETITRSAAAFRSIPMKRPVEEVPVISLVGEIFVRRDSLSRQFLIKKLARKGFAVVTSPFAEWIYYINHLVSNGYLKNKPFAMEKLEAMFRKKFFKKYEKTIKTTFQESGVYHGHMVDIQRIIDVASPFIPLDLTGETVLTVGSALMEIASHACGVIAIGPFGCMPNRIAESILNKTMIYEEKLKADPGNGRFGAGLSDVTHLPFLVIESDGMPFPQIIEAKMEAFLLRAKRLHSQMQQSNPGEKKLYS